jgi:hypothetical protein
VSSNFRATLYPKFFRKTLKTHGLKFQWSCDIIIIIIITIISVYGRDVHNYSNEELPMWIVPAEGVIIPSFKNSDLLHTHLLDLGDCYSFSHNSCFIFRKTEGYRALSEWAKGKVIPVQSLKAHRRNRRIASRLLLSALHAVEWQPSVNDRFRTRERSAVPIIHGPWKRSTIFRREKNSISLPGFESWIIQLVANHYTTTFTVGKA